jgi:hypothetical protein
MTPPVKPSRAIGQVAGDQRRAVSDEPGSTGTSGDRWGLSGLERVVVIVGWGVALAIIAMITLLDILTRAHVQPQVGLGPPLIDELSSALVTLLLMTLPIGLALWMRRRSPPIWQAAFAYLAGAALYSVLHVSGFVALRKLGYALFLGRSYSFGRLPDEYLYEAGKDVPAFLFSAAIFWVLLRLIPRLMPEARGADAPAWFDIRDGARVLRVPVSDILAVRSAGNYVEFLLGDGRSPLMRAALSALEPRLAAHGFVRTHRSWLVNSGRMSGLRPDGSGDYTVELGALEAPLSRRFRQALDRLRS